MTDGHTAYDPYPTAAMERQYREDNVIRPEVICTRKVYSEAAYKKLDDDYAKLEAERDEWKAASKEGLKLCEQYRAELAEARAQRDRLREALEKALPIVIDTLRHLRATNHKAALKVTNDLADIRTALQEAGE